MKSLSSQKLSVACSVAVAGCLGSVLAVVGGELEPSARGHAGAGSFSDTVVTIAGDAGFIGIPRKIMALKNLKAITGSLKSIA